MTSANETPKLFAFDADATLVEWEESTIISIPANWRVLLTQQDIVEVQTGLNRKEN